MAGVYKGLRIEISADDGNLQRALNRNTNEAKKLTRELRDVEKSLKFDSHSPDMLAQKMQKIQQHAENTKDRLKLLKQAESELGQANMSTEQWTELQGDISACEAKLRAYNAQLRELGAQKAAAESALGGIGGMLASHSEAFDRAGTGMQTVGRTLTHTVTPAIIGGAAASVKAAIDIDTALTGVRKTVDGTEQDYQALKDAAIEFSKANATSATDFLDAQALGAQLGFNIDELQRFAEVATGLDIATNMDLETAASEMARFANITKMSHDDIENYASAIVNVGNNMATTESEVSSMAMRLAAASTQVGMSQADILGLAGALSSLGVEAEAGGTAVSTIMATIDKAVASNSEELATWASAAGMSADQFASSWKEKPVEALSAVLSGMERATEEGGNMSLMLEELGISSLRQTDVMKRMAGNSELMAEGVRIANEGWNENVALSNEVANRNDSLAAKFEILKNRIVAIAEEVGAPLADAMLAAVDTAEPLFEAIESGARAFSEMSKSEQEAVLKTVAFAAALGPALTGMGGFVKALGPLGDGMQGLARGLAKADMAVFGTAAAEASAAAGAAATGGIALLVAALAGAAIGIKNAVDEANNYRDATTGLVEASESVASSMGAAFEGSADAAESSQQRVKDALEKQAQFARDLDSELSSIGKDSTLLDGYVDKIRELAGHCEGDAQKLGELRIAVEQYNSITGDSIGIIDDQSGAIDRSTEALARNAEAWEQNAYKQALTEKMTELAKLQIDNHENLAKATADLAAAQDELNRVKDEKPWDTDAILAATLSEQALQEAVDKAKEAYDSNAEAMENLSGKAEEMAVKEAESRQAANDLAAEHERLTNALTEAGFEAGEASRLVSELQAQGIDSKHFHVDDDGTIRDNMGRIIDLDNKTIDGKPYEVTDNGTIRQLMAEEAKLNAYPIENKLATVTGDNSDAMTKVNEVERAKVNDKTATVSIIDRATSVLSGIIGMLTGITDRSATVTTRHVAIAEARNNASGGVVPGYMAGAIFTQATLTDQGWVGEAGAEAYLPGANGSGAIVPLTNRRYVRPFAQAVAAEMGAARESTVINKYYNVGGIDYTPDSRMANLVEQMVDMAIVEGRM